MQGIDSGQKPFDPRPVNQGVEFVGEPFFVFDIQDPVVLPEEVCGFDGGVKKTGGEEGVDVEGGDDHLVVDVMMLDHLHGFFGGAAEECVAGFYFDVEDSLRSVLY